MEYNNLIQKYLSKSSWRIRENANTNESFSNMQNFIASNILANDFLSSLPYKYRKAHQDAIIHIHNLESGGYQPYCCGHNLKTLIVNGMKTVTINAKPAKHLTSVTDQIMNWLFMSQQEFCLGANTKIYAKFSKRNKIELSEMSKIVNSSDKVSILHNGKWIDIIEKYKFPIENKSILKITLYDNTSIICTAEHRLMTTNGLVEAKSLKPSNRINYNLLGDKLILDLQKYEGTVPSSWELGYFIGFYAAEGDCERNDELRLANNNKDILDKLCKYIESNFGCKGSYYFDKKGTYRLSFYSPALVALAKYFVLGNLSTNKRLSGNVYTQSLDFRKGLWEGYMAGDGCKIRNAIVSFSDRMLYSLKYLLTSIGEMGIIRKESHEIYCKKQKLKYIRIRKIEPYTPRRQIYVYDIRLDSGDHLFTLANGVISHNSGAQAFNDFDTLIAPFIRVDKLSYKEVKQQMQKLIYNLNMTMRAANQTPFTNLSLNYCVPRFLEDEEAIVGGNSTGFKYSDCLDEISMVDRAISELMMDKDPNGIPFTFPILTINLTKKFDWNSEASRLMAENANKVGSYYWMSYLGSGIDEDSIRSLCCRLNIDMRELSGPSGLWNTAEGTGSLGVVTINFPRLGFDCKGKEEDIFFEKLSERLEMALFILNFRKERIGKYQNKMMPFNLLNAWSMKNYFITIGVIGFNEMCLNYIGTEITQNIPFIEKVMKFLRRWVKEKQIETKQLINIEMIPGEGSAYRLAYVDRKLNPGIITLGTKSAPYYTSLLIPASSDIDLFERLKLEEKILPLFTGGTIFRVFTGEKEVDTNIILELIKKISGTKIPYFDLTNTFSICKEEKKTFRGIKYKCPLCKGETEIFSRVVGYYRPLEKFNIGKVQEFHDRKYIDVEKV